AVDLLFELVVNGVEAKHKRMTLDLLKIRYVGVGVELPAIKQVIRDLDLTGEVGNTLFRDNLSSAGELAVKLRGGDIANRLVFLEVLVKAVRLTANNKNIAAFAVLVRRRVSDHKTGLVVKIRKQARVQVEGSGLRKLGEIIVVNIIFSLIVE